jgi:hypothetical protein
MTAGLCRYFRNIPTIFDLALDDELVYMGVGTDFTHAILWPKDFSGVYSSYEYGGLYSGIYGVLAFFFRDPIDLYMYGGVAIIAFAVVAGFCSTLLLSGDLFFAAAVTSGVVLSGELMTWPRVSFGAIGVLVLAFCLVARLKSATIKICLLLCTAYLLSFIRPEFVLSFYSLILILLGLMIGRAWQIRRIGAAEALPKRGELMAIGIALVFVVAMSILWSFPILAGGDRAFTAFGAHYAVQYAAAHSLSLEAWIDWRKIVAEEFPGADSVYAAILIDPGKMLAYFANNLADLGVSIGRIVLGVAEHHSAFAVVGSVAALLWAGSLTRWRRQIIQGSVLPRWLDVILMSIFAFPPLIATITIFPRHHYIILLLFTLSSILAVVVPRNSRRLTSLVSLGIAVVFLLSATPLTPVSQPILQTAMTLREKFHIRRMFEIDGGWCYLQVPRCIEEYAEWMPDSASFETYVHEHNIDTIMLSPRLRNYESAHHPEFMADIEELKNSEHWQAFDLGNGYILVQASF